jgi:AcrR family transcriptional regulator
MLSRRGDMGYKSDQTRAKLLHSFNDLIYKQGYKATTLRQIAEATGISLGHLYFYHKTKASLQKALSEDLYGKIEIILDSFFKRSIGSAMNRFLARHILILYLIAKKKELFKVSAGWAESIDVLDNKTELFYRESQKVYKSIDLAVDDNMLKSISSTAVWAKFSIIRSTYKNRMELDYIYAFRVMFGILFHQTSFPDYQSCIDKTIDWFESQNKDALIEKVYDMDAYNYPWD